MAAAAGFDLLAIRSKSLERHVRTVGGLLIQLAARTVFGWDSSATEPRGSFAIGCHDGCQSSLLDRAVDTVGNNGAPGQDASAQEGEDGADADEDGAFGVVGLLHKGGSRSVGDDDAGYGGTGYGGQI